MHLLPFHLIDYESFILIDHNCNLFVAAKYDIAVSTACPGLDYIVVETTAAAQACVELLRRKNLGVATFMILVLGSYFVILLEVASHSLVVCPFILYTSQNAI